MPFVAPSGRWPRQVSCPSLPAAAQDTLAVSPVDLHGFLQVYYRTGDPLIKDGYRLRKADWKFSGNISPRRRRRIAFDAAKALNLNKSAAVGDSLALGDASVDQKSRMLQDAALTYAVNRQLQIDVGQQIVPLSYEGTIPSAKVETIERTLFISERSRAVGLGDVRDIVYSSPLFTLRGEVMQARDGSLHRLGWYGLGALRPTSRLQRSARFDSWDRDRTHESLGGRRAGATGRRGRQLHHRFVGRPSRAQRGPADVSAHRNRATWHDPSRCVSSGLVN
jgi:hypothetical protein